MAAEVKRGEIYGWNYISKAFDVLDKLKPKKCLEIGSYLGGSTVTILTKCPESTITCIDTWLGWAGNYITKEGRNEASIYLYQGYPTLFHRFKENMEIRGLGNRIRAIPLPSSEAYEALKSNGDSFDFIYVDGSHRYRDVFYDLECYWNLLNPGGIMMLDDYENSYWTEVKTACDDWLRDKDYTREFIDRKAVIYK